MTSVHLVSGSSEDGWLWQYLRLMVVIHIIAIRPQAILLIVVIMAGHFIVSLDPLDVLGGHDLLVHHASAGGWWC